MEFEHIVVHRGADYHCAFPEIIRLQNGELVTVFREAAFHPPRVGTTCVIGRRGHRLDLFGRRRIPGHKGETIH